MRNIFVSSFLCFLVSCSTPQSDNQKMDIAADSLIVKALADKLSYDNYWAPQWETNQEREIRYVKLDKDKYLVAFDVLKKDSICGGGKKRQLAYIDNSGQGPLVTFPALPYFLETLKNVNETDNNDINTSHYKLLCDKQQHKSTYFTLMDAERVFSHDTIWSSRVREVEKELLVELTDIGFKEGVVVINDLLETDEQFQGFAVSTAGKSYVLCGEIYRFHSLASEYLVRIQLRDAPTNSVNRDTYFCSIIRQPVIMILTEDERGQRRLVTKGVCK